MSKISLKEAQELIDTIVISDVFSSLVSDTLLEDKGKLQTYINLKHKIYTAEKHFGLDDFRSIINILETKAQYHKPETVVFYYKHSISQEIKDSNKDIWDDIMQDIAKVECEIARMSEHIFIEVS